MSAGVGVGNFLVTPIPTPARITDSDRLRLRLRSPDLNRPDKYLRHLSFFSPLTYNGQVTKLTWP